MARQRTLAFDSLDEAIQDAQQLLHSGYDQHGAWDLSQCCGHLDRWLTFPMDGFPNPGFAMGAVLWMMKNTIAQSQLQKILADGFKPGTPTMPVSIPTKDEFEDATALSNLTATVQRFDAHAGTLHPSPLFGAIDKETLLNLQLKHFAHHLGFFSVKA